MTTIAWDGKTLVSDSLSSVDNYVFSTNETKIHTPTKKQKWSINGEIILAIGNSGDTGAIHQIIRNLNNGILFDTTFEHNYSFNVLAIAENKIFLLNKFENISSIYIIEHYGKYAIGSGGLLARSAMTLGCNAQEAVLHAIKLDIDTGGELQIYERNYS